MSYIWNTFTARLIGACSYLEVRRRSCQMPKRTIIHALRSWVAERFQIEDEAASRGYWWEIDLIIVILLGAVVVGMIAWFQIP